MSVISMHTAQSICRVRKANLSYKRSVPCNEDNPILAVSCCFNRSASARKSAPLVMMSPGTTYASENSEKCYPVTH